MLNFFLGLSLGSMLVFRFSLDLHTRREMAQVISESGFVRVYV